MAPPTHDPRIDQLVEVLIAFSRQDFTQRAPIGDALDELDAIAAGLNMLAEDLHGAVASKRELEIAYAALKEAQAKVLHNGKLIAIGQLASAVAHEINSPVSWVAISLNQMTGCIAKVRELATANSQSLGQTVTQLEQLVSHAIEGMERIRGVAGDLRTFSRADGDELEAVSLNEVVEAACRFARHSISTGIQLRIRLSEDAPRVDGNRGRLAQVVTNLLLNALQAITSTTHSARELNVETLIDANEAVVIVEDSGPGVPPALRTRIFEPYFTTKSAELGTGLGLSLVADIVNQHRGSVDVADSRLGGARFAVRLPLRRRSADAVELAADAQVPECRARVLIVDDELMLLRSYEMVLRDAHDVVTASKGSDALRILSQDTNFDVVLCDLQMPEMDGIQIFNHTLRSSPELAERFVFSTGGGVQPHIRAFLASTRMPVLQKPIRVEVLLARLTQMAQRSRLRKA